MLPFSGFQPLVYCLGSSLYSSNYLQEVSLDRNLGLAAGLSSSEEASAVKAVVHIYEGQKIDENLVLTGSSRAAHPLRQPIDLYCCY
jgi:hypothetical protein